MTPKAEHKKKKKLAPMVKSIKGVNKVSASDIISLLKAIR